MKETKVKKVLIQLEEAVDRDSKQKLNEADLLHLALETWESLEHASHSWHRSKREILKAVAVSLFGAAIVHYDLGKVWKKLTKMNMQKARKILQATRIINTAKTSTQAIEAIHQQLGIDVPKEGEVI